MIFKKSVHTWQKSKKLISLCSCSFTLLSSNKCCLILFVLILISFLAGVVSRKRLQVSICQLKSQELWNFRTMGSPLGPSLANVFLYHFEEQWMSDCPIDYKPISYRRYVDDTFLLFSSELHVIKLHEF